MITQTDLDAANRAVSDLEENPPTDTSPGADALPGDGLDSHSPAPARPGAGTISRIAPEGAALAARAALPLGQMLIWRMAVDNAESGAAMIRAGNLRMAKSHLVQCLAEIEHLERMQSL